MAPTNPSSDVDHDPPVDPTPANAGSSTTGLGAAEIEHAMPPARDEADDIVPIDADEAIQREVEAERIDQVSDGEPV